MAYRLEVNGAPYPNYLKEKEGVAIEMARWLSGRDGVRQVRVINTETNECVHHIGAGIVHRTS